MPMSNIRHSYTYTEFVELRRTFLVLSGVLGTATCRALFLIWVPYLNLAICECTSPAKSTCHSYFPIIVFWFYGLHFERGIPYTPCYWWFMFEIAVCQSILVHAFQEITPKVSKLLLLACIFRDLSWNKLTGPIPTNKLAPNITTLYVPLIMFVYCL